MERNWIHVTLKIVVWLGNSTLSMVETVVAVNHQQQSKEGEELAQLSITSADYNKLSEEVERLQKQLAGMDDSRMETESLNKHLYLYLYRNQPKTRLIKNHHNYN